MLSYLYKVDNQWYWENNRIISILFYCDSGSKNEIF